jgi:hypothetical protein
MRSLTLVVSVQQLDYEQSGSHSGPEVGFGETAINLLQARFGTTSDRNQFVMTVDGHGLTELVFLTVAQKKSRRSG